MACVESALCVGGGGPPSWQSASLQNEADEMRGRVTFFRVGLSPCPLRDAVISFHFAARGRCLPGPPDFELCPAMLSPALPPIVQLNFKFHPSPSAVVRPASAPSSCFPTSPPLPFPPLPFP
ncbi:hypothetical protein AcW2_007365 [Taiwanofungus camphoratus]|nr:hypothetical protein AcW2_007365 [Antrodia cinnamomea]